jgi:hypothetical protein
VVALWGAAMLASCGGGPKLSNLRCRQVPCQDPEDPFMLRLQVDFDDPSGTLGSGALELLVDGDVQEAVSLSDLFSAQGIAATATQGTLQVDEELQLETVSAGEQLSAGLRAKNGDGEESNAPELDLVLSLGGGD